MKAFLILALILAITGCTDDTDPPWQLDHDRIIAIRATPPRIDSGDRAVIDGLRGAKGAPLSEGAPDQVTVLSPASLVDTVAHDAGKWTITAPGAAQLAAARTELGLAAGAPVPLSIEASYGTLRATKTVWLGATSANPAMAGIEIDRAAAPPEATELVIPPLVDVPMSIGLSDADYDVTWLTSCGTMHDFDLPSAYVHVKADDPMAGQLALVVRDANGGVSWEIWPIRATAPPP